MIRRVVCRRNAHRSADNITNIVRFIKSQTLRWAAHVIRMDTTRTVKKLTEWEPYSSRPVGRPRLRWLDQVEEDLKR